MPWTAKQRRLFAVKYRNGELSKKKFDKMMGEGIRKPVRKGKKKTTARRHRKG